MSSLATCCAEDPQTDVKVNPSGDSPNVQTDLFQIAPLFRLVHGGRHHGAGHLLPCAGNFGERRASG
jgi:hypothetical protein